MNPYVAAWTFLILVAIICVPFLIAVLREGHDKMQAEHKAAQHAPRRR